MNFETWWIQIDHHHDEQILDVAGSTCVCSTLFCVLIMIPAHIVMKTRPPLSFIHSFDATLVKKRVALQRLIFSYLIICMAFTQPITNIKWDQKLLLFTKFVTYFNIDYLEFKYLEKLWFLLGILLFLNPPTFSNLRYLI